MPEEKKKNGMACGCGTGACGCGMSCSRAWLRIVRGIFAVVIMVIIFMLGVKIGELRGMLEGRHGFRMTGAQSFGGYGQYPMMRGMPPVAATSSAQ
jgi:hypothetical protein